MRSLVIGMVVALLFSGCASPSTDDPAKVVPTSSASELHIQGIVFDAALRPLQGAIVALESTNLSQTTGAGGAFDFQINPGKVTLVASSLGYYPFRESYDVGSDMELSVVMRPLPQPRNETMTLDGYIDCAAEYLIISGSCDLVLDEYSPVAIEVFAQQDSFVVQVENGWLTTVVDVYFENLGPGLEGLRLSAYLNNSEDQLTSYERFAQASSSEPFSLRIEPGVDYGDKLIAPENATAFQFQVFPEGYLKGQACDPLFTQSCFLGIGGAQRIDFSIFVTTFYVEQAPEGFTLL